MALITSGCVPFSCPICWATLPASRAAGRVTTACGHEFCIGCLHWLLQTGAKGYGQ